MKLGFMIESQLIFLEKMNLDQLDWNWLGAGDVVGGVLEVELPLNLLRSSCANSKKLL